MSERHSLPLRAEAARKALHLGTAMVPIGLAFGWIDQSLLRLVLTTAALVALAVETLRWRSSTGALSFDRAFGSLLRTHERRAITGATWLAIAMALVLWLAPLHAAIAALWAAAVGDATAAIVGRSLQRWQQRPPSGKTIAGSGAALVATTSGVLWLTPATAVVALALGAVAAAAERPAGPLDDNLRVALCVALAAIALGLR